MSFIYHRVPDNMRGKTLYPLNQLKELHQDLYAEIKQKYDWRESVMEKKIPKWDCLWNDVLHLTPVDPHKIKEALVVAGREDNTRKYFQFDAHNFGPADTVVYLYRDTGALDTKETYFVDYDPNNLEQYNQVTSYTLQYYQDKVAQGGMLLVHHGLPHIFYRKSLDVSDVPVITV